MRDYPSVGPSKFPLLISTLNGRVFAMTSLQKKKKKKNNEQLPSLMRIYLEKLIVKLAWFHNMYNLLQL